MDSLELTFQKRPRITESTLDLCRVRAMLRRLAGKMKMCSDGRPTLLNRLYQFAMLALMVAELVGVYLIVYLEWKR